MADSPDRDYNTRVRITNDVSTFRRQNTTQFFESRVAQKNPQLVLNADLPLSERRDQITTQNNGVVTKDNGEYLVRANADANSFAKLRSRQRGTYLTGSILEVGLGVRIPQQPTGDAYIKWGYYDGDDGVYFKYTSEGIFLEIEKGGDVTSIPQQEWNTDNLTGRSGYRNPSGSELDLADGAIFQIPFAYYGYGALNFEIGIPKGNEDYYVRRVHQQNMKGDTSIDRPNLPIAIEVDSGTSGQQLDVFVAGRQISALGNSDEIERQSAAYRLEVANIGTSFVPLISFRQKDGFEQVPIRLGGVSINPDVDMIIELHRNSTLDGANFTSFGNYPADESATEWDVSATSTYTAGEALYTDFVSGGNKGAVSSVNLPTRPISEIDTVTLAARRISGTNGNASAILRAREDW